MEIAHHQDHLGLPLIGSVTTQNFGCQSAKRDGNAAKHSDVSKSRMHVPLLEIKIDSPIEEAKYDSPGRDDREAQQDADDCVDELAPQVFVLVIPIGNDLQKPTNGPGKPHQKTVNIDPGLFLEEKLVGTTTPARTILAKGHCPFKMVA